MNMTPGPWRVTKLSDGRYCIGSDCNSRDVAKGVFREANARAIAEVPEMVDLLHSILTEFDEGVVEAASEKFMNLMDRAEVLLRRIEGKEETK